MFQLRQMKIQAKIFSAIGVFSLGFLVYGILSFNTLNKVKVNGPIYKTIIHDKDLIADILPPPENILEAFIVVHQMADEDDKTKINRLLEECKRLRNEYETRHEYWDNILEEGRLKETLIEKSYLPAKEFFDIRDKEFIPAILSGQGTRARDVILPRMEEAYYTHHVAIEEAVKLAT